MIRRFIAIFLFCLVPLGTVGAQDTPVLDPLEGFNRAMFRFNTDLDEAFLQPIARTYRDVVPQPVRVCIGNVFSNLADIGTGVNNALQGKFGSAATDFCRVAINSTVGLLGCFDVASEMGLPKHNEDFGQTLAVWGVPAGPYLVLPFFGPSSLRDSVATFTVDRQLDAIPYVDPTRTRNQLIVTRVVSRRAELLQASSLLDAAALDAYVFMRDAYFQRRRNQVYDGEPPEEPRAAEPIPLAAPAR